MEQPTALLIIDLFSLFDFPQGRQLAPYAVRAAQRTARLRAAFDAHRSPVIYANDNFGNWQRDFPQLVEACRQKGGASSTLPPARNTTSSSSRSTPPSSPRHCRCCWPSSAPGDWCWPAWHWTRACWPLPSMPTRASTRRWSPGKRSPPCRTAASRPCRPCSDRAPSKYSATVRSSLRCHPRPHVNARAWHHRAEPGLSPGCASSPAAAASQRDNRPGIPGRRRCADAWCPCRPC